MKKIFKFRYHSPSAQDTLRIGKKIGELAQKGDVILLCGDLGTGKTWLTKGIAKGLGVPKNYPITSPSFVFVHVYPGCFPLYHIDLYRLEKDVDWSLLGLEEYLFSEGVTVIEWAEKMPASLLPPQYLKIYIYFSNEGRDLEFVTNIAYFKQIGYYLKN